MTEIEAKVIQHDEQIKTIKGRVDRLESIAVDINKLAVSVERLAINQSQMLEEQRAQKDATDGLKVEIDEIKLKPAKDAHDLKNKIIVSVVTGVIGAILGAVFAMIFKS